MNAAQSTVDEVRSVTSPDVDERRGVVARRDSIREIACDRTPEPSKPLTERAEVASARQSIAPGHRLAGLEACGRRGTAGKQSAGRRERKGWIRGWFNHE